MSPVPLFHPLELLLCLAILILFFATVWQQLCTDITRQNHFELRNRLFLLAMDGKLEFDDPLYREISEFLNIRIRMAHRISISSLIACLMTRRETIPETRTPFDDLEKVEDVAIRSELRGIHRHSARSLLLHVIARSPLYLVFIPLAGLIPLLLFFAGGSGDCRNLSIRLIRVLDDETLIRRALPVS